jgi:molybdopterin-guanine dinucleotide biosynthesis protein A
VDELVVAVLAGGRGSRLGGDKAMVELGGRPLIERPLAAARAAGLDAVVVAKRGTALPDVPTWVEPDEPSHPLLGLITALEHGPVVAVACDQPWLSPELLRALAEHDGPAIAVEREPFPGRYEPLQLPVLRAALHEEASLRATLGRLQPAVLAWRREEVASVNTREDLDAARRAAAGDDAHRDGEPVAGGDGTRS